MLLDTFLNQLRTSPETIEFNQTIDTINAAYHYTPTAFNNGEVENEAGQNEGSCKIFAFARLHELTKEETLHCFGKYYREDVLLHPDDDNHQNIRQFIQLGWPGISFEKPALSVKTRD